MGHLIFLLPVDYFDQAPVWQLKFVLWPRRCSISGRRIFLEWAYRGIATRVGMVEIIFHPMDEIQHEIHWHNNVEHLIWRLKQ